MLCFMGNVTKTFRAVFGFFMAACMTVSVSYAAAQEPVAGAKQTAPDSMLQNKEDIYMEPSFMGGDLTDFRKWVMMNVEYPVEAVEQGIEGTVIATFVVTPKGKVADIQIISSPSLYLSNAVREVLSMSPKWSPAINADGEPVCFFFHIPVIFRFDNSAF